MDKPTRNPEAGYPLTDLRDDYGEAWKYIEHLEGMLGKERRASDIITAYVKELEATIVAGNLCEAEISLVSGSPADTEMRQALPPFQPLSMGFNGKDRTFADSMSVLVNEANGMAVWRFYRKAGH